MCVATYGKLATPPEPLNDAQVVETEHREEYLCGIGEAQLRFC